MVLNGKKKYPLGKQPDKKVDKKIKKGGKLKMGNFFVL